MSSKEDFIEFSKDQYRSNIVKLFSGLLKEDLHELDIDPKEFSNMLADEVMEDYASILDELFTEEESEVILKFQKQLQPKLLILEEKLNEKLLTKSEDFNEKLQSWLDSKIAD